MDYKSYKAMCDSTLQQIRKSENKREELNNKLQKMYQEKSECEKSIIKTLESQQKQFMEEKRRRAERNENILRTLDRIDYQAQVLAAKSERLRALKKQYERYLLSLWATRRVAVYPIQNQNLNIGSVGSSSSSNIANGNNFLGPFTAKYDELSAHQSSYYGYPNISAFNSDLSRPQQQPSKYLSAPIYNSNSFTSPSSPPPPPSPILSQYTHSNNETRYRSREVPLTAAAALENSIKSGNYPMTTAKTGAFDSSYPSAPSSTSHQVRYDYMTQMPLLKKHHEDDKKSSYHLSNDNAINIGEMNIPTTINSIYSHTDLHQQKLSPQLPLDGSSSSSQPFYSIYQRNNQPLENRHNNNNNNNNYNSSEGNMKMSKAFHDNPLIMPAHQATTTTASAVTTDLNFSHFSPLPQNISTLSSSLENRLKNDNEIHMSDTDADSESDQMAFASKHHARKLEIPIANAKFDDIKQQQQQILPQKHSMGITDMSSSSSSPFSTALKSAETKSINESKLGENENDGDGNNTMHQVWERVVEAEPFDAQQQQQQHEQNIVNNFVIPKIIVETQIDLTDAPTTTITMVEQHHITTAAMNDDENVEKQDRVDIPEKLLNQTSNNEMEKHSSDNRQNGSLTSTLNTSVTAAAAAPYNNLPLTEEQSSSIYHYDDKQQVQNSDEQQQQQNNQKPQSSVEYELRNFNDDIKISSNHHHHGDKIDDTKTMTCDSEIKSNISLTEGDTKVAVREAINNINDDKNLKISPLPTSSSSSSSTAVGLNDKISEIYRKIEKIEGEYYGEKGKIMENFERRMSASSLNDEAKADAQMMENKYDDANVNSSDVVISSLKSQEQEFNQNIKSAEFDFESGNNNDEMRKDKNEENSIYECDQSEAATTENTQEIQNSSQMDIQSNYNYEQAVGEQQQQSYVENSYNEYPQNDENFNQNQQSMYATENLSDVMMDNNIDNDNNGELQTTSVEQYSYEPSQPAALQQYENNYTTEGDYVYANQQQEQQHQPEYIENANIETNNFNLYNQQQQQQQLDSNYLQNSNNNNNNNNYETIENPSNYESNNDGAVYYDYDTSSQNYATTAENYDDQNYAHQQIPTTLEYQSGNGNNDGSALEIEPSQTNEYFYQHDDGNGSSSRSGGGGGDIYQDHSNESNYNTVANRQQQEENFIETSNDTYEYQSTTDGSYTTNTELYRDTQMSLENANYDTQQQQQQQQQYISGNENFEQNAIPTTTTPTMKAENYDREDESYQTTSSSDASSLQAQAQAHDIIEGKENASVLPTKRDDVKLVKQLLDSESDDTTTSRSNLLKTAIKEEADESDFDFSAN